MLHLMYFAKLLKASKYFLWHFLKCNLDLYFLNLKFKMNWKLNVKFRIDTKTIFSLPKTFKPTTPYFHLVWPGVPTLLSIFGLHKIITKHRCEQRPHARWTWSDIPCVIKASSARWRMSQHRPKQEVISYLARLLKISIKQLKKMKSSTQRKKLAKRKHWAQPALTTRATAKSNESRDRLMFCWHGFPFALFPSWYPCYGSLGGLRIKPLEDHVIMCSGIKTQETDVQGA